MYVSSLSSIYFRKHFVLLLSSYIYLNYCIYIPVKYNNCSDRLNIDRNHDRFMPMFKSYFSIILFYSSTLLIDKIDH